MSKWTDFRDKLVDALNVEDITEDFKQKVLADLTENAMPVIKETVLAFADKVKAQAANENGWCAIRDAFVLPITLNVLVYIIEMILGKTLENTSKA